MNSQPTFSFHRVRFVRPRKAVSLDPPVCVIDWAKPGIVHHVTSIEVAAEHLIKWPITKKRDKAAALIADAYAGEADPEQAKKAFASRWVFREQFGFR